MGSYEKKIVPDLLRWLGEDSAQGRTVMIRLSYSQDPQDAAEEIGKQGMSVQSSGPGLVIASSNREAVRKVAKFSWVVSIDIPRKLDKKSLLDKLRG